MADERADQAQMGSMQCVRVAVAAVRDAVVLVDVDARVQHLNPAAERMTGWSVGDALGGRVSDVVELRSGHRAHPVAEHVQHVLSGGAFPAPRQGTYLVSRGGSRIRVDQRVTPVVNDVGAVVGAVIVLVDLSEGEQLQLLLARADRLASMGTMAASIAHEVNNPLTYMLLNLESVSRTLSDEGREPAMLEALRDVEVGARAIERIVRDLKLLSTPDQRSEEAVEVAPVLRRTQRMAAKAVRARGRFEASLPTTHPVYANAVALGQVVTNLVLNAAQALPDHYSDDHVVRLSCRDLGEHVVIEVQDNGIGIPDSAMGRIFDPFFTTKAVGHGTGLGLAICHQIISDLDGSIEVESEEGVGTTVRVLLPTTSVVPEDADVNEIKLRGGSWPIRRVLLVDDDAYVRRAMASGLRRVHQVDAVGSVDEAAACLGRGVGYDAILCDIMMSPRNGLEILDELALHAPDLMDRTAFITGGVFTGVLQDEILRAGRPVAYKPFRPDELLRLVEGLSQG